MPFCLTEGHYFGDAGPLLQNELFQCSISRYAPGETIRKHYHENAYLSLLVRGNYFEQNASGSQLLEKGAVIFRPSAYDHANAFQNSGGTCLNIELKKGFEEHTAVKLKLPAQTKIYSTGSIAAVYRLLHYFTREADAALCFEEAMHCFLETGENLPVKSRLPWLEKVKKILGEETETRHTLQAVADRVFVHPVYLSAAFKKKTGFTISEYQLQVRLKKALGLLFSSKMPVHEIAAQCGFYDAAHFVRSFQLVYRVSPRRFRVALNA